MGNSRGNLYSREHVSIDPNSEAFWKFSWDQMAQFDLPAQMSYIRNETGYDRVGWIGHSEGTMVVFAGLSLHPEWADMFSVMIAFGPVATVGHITNEFLLLLADLDVDELFLLFGVKQFLPSSELLDKLDLEICRTDPNACDDLIELLCGPHRGAFNNSRMQVMGAHEPGGTSVQNVAHFAQGVRKDDFAMFDYGLVGNREHYHSDQPPTYNLSQFPTSLPVALWYGTDDELADPTDVAWLIGHLPSTPVVIVELNQYAHLDFVWDYTAVFDFYHSVITLLKNSSQTG